MTAPVGSGPRVLETILTGTNRLSPMLASASKDVVAFNSTVARAQEKAAVGASASASRQEAATAKVTASNVKASTSASTSADQQVRAYTRTAESATASASAQARAHSKAAESATLSARAQQSTNRALAASNGLLGTSLTPLTAGLGIVALGLGYAAYRGMEFDTAMSKVQAATMASAGTMKQLRDAAIDQGAKTKYSSEEAARGITEMAKAGVSTADILHGGLAGALNLAAAGEIDVGQAAEIAATQLTVFKLKGDQVNHVADLLAAGAGKAQGSVSDLALALQYAGLPAKGLSMSIEETTGVLGLFASNGLVGEKAGTSFRGMLTSLTNATPQTQKVMDDLNLSFFDAQGHFIGMSGVAQQLHDKLGPLTEETRNAALAQIFGNVSLGAAQILYNSGSAGVQKWTKNVSDAGYASRQASINQDNLRGDLEKLGGAFDSTMTTIGGGAQGPLRELVQALTSIVTVGGDVLGFFNSLPGPAQAAIVAFAAWALAGGKVMGVFDGIRTKLAAFREEQELQRALQAMQQSSTANMATSYGTLAERIDATTGVSRNLGGEVGAVSSKFSTAKAAIGAFARSIGPELGVAAAVYAIASLAGSVDKIANAGDGARTEVRDLNRNLGDIDGNDARIQATASAITDLGHKLADAKAAAGDSKDFIPSLGNPLAMADAIAKYKDASSSVDVYSKALTDLKGQQDRSDAATKGLSERYGITSDQVLHLADTYGIDLTKGLDAASEKFVSSGAAGEIAKGAITSVGDAAGMTQDQIKEAAKALEDWRKQLQQVSTDFVEPLGVYKDLLSQKQQAEHDSAQATADATKNSKDSWKDYVKDVTVSLDEYATKLEEQLTAQENWRTNLVTVTKRGGLEVGQALAAMGVEGAGITEQMANATGADFNRMKNDLIRDARLGGAGATAELDNAMKIMAAVASSGGKATAASLAKQLGIGADQVAAIAKQYGIKLAEGINPVLIGLGKPVITATKLRMGKDYDVGGYTGPGARKQPAGIVHAGEVVWSQDDVAAHGGPQRVEAMRTSRRGYEGGGFVTASDVPRPSSTAPYRFPVSTPGDAAMQTGFDDVRAWLKNNVSVGPAAGSGVQRWLPVVLQSLSMIGQPASLAQTVLRRMQQESGGNPTIVNRWDSNWANGTPSVGLMQVIGPTYRSNRDARRDVGPYLYGTSVDPLANILASEHYAISRYGSLSAAYNKAGGYDSGGLATKAGLLAKGTVAPERVLSPRQTAAFERWMATAPAAMPGYGMGGGGGGAAAVVKVAAPDLRGLTIQGRVTVDGNGIATIAGRVVDQALGEHADFVHYAGG